MVKNPPAMQDTWVRYLGWEDPPEKGTATHSSILAWRIPWTEESGGLHYNRSQRVGHDWATFTFSKNEASDKIKNPIPWSLWLWKKAFVHSAYQFPRLQRTPLSYPKVGPLITGTTANKSITTKAGTQNINKAEHQFQIPFL